MQFIWEEFLKIIKEEAGSGVVETWFKAVNFQSWDKDSATATLVVPNQFVSKWLQEHYSYLIKTHLSRLLSVNSIQVFFTCKNADIVSHKKIMPASALQKQLPIEIMGKPGFDSVLERAKPKSTYNGHKKYMVKSCPPLSLASTYTFDNFVVGPSNSLAHAAAFAVSQNPGRVYNPLFIYGGTGLGKTHLLCAIANEIRKQKPSLSVYYETSDNFMNQFVNSIRTDKAKQFREKYSKVDLLLLDDIQFFSNKEQTQETFFHILDSLYVLQKQVVFSSDTMPSDITGLQNRLKSRLQCGLVADVHMPTLEMKMAILKKKAILQQSNLDDEIAKFIASKPVSSIRELEGYLIRLNAYSSLTQQPLSLDLARKILMHTGEKKTTPVSLDSIVKQVARVYMIDTADLKAKARSKEVALARQVAFYMMKKFTSSSLRTIGEYFGGRDHTTVIHAINKIESLVETSQPLKQKINEIESYIARTNR